MAELSLLVVDDEELIRAGLRLLLDGAEGLRIAGEAADGSRAVELAAALDPDVVLLDLRMPGMDGFACAEQLLADDPARTVLVLTTFDADETVLRALELGVAGFLLKDTPPTELVRSVRQAAEGAPVLSPSVARQVISRATAPCEDAGRRAARDLIASLTGREMEIARAVAEGMTNQQIAEAQFVSLPTVKTHISRIMQKLEADNRVKIALAIHRAELA
ncbi:response regulator transcription factor [Nesterenkonia sp. F]|uniref:response regulator n=1 Tax=Nesterenkonia sp. F TaxID=795955 RepID=UPI0002E2CBA9|nr:response regulator transcription factor [Nesterenkonia sp. F]